MGQFRKSCAWEESCSKQSLDLRGDPYIPLEPSDTSRIPSYVVNNL